MSKKNLELLTLSPDQSSLNYGGYSKLIINKLSQQLIVEPFDEDIKMVSASFNCNFILKQNILFADSPGGLTNFAIIFTTPIISQKVFNIIVKNRTTVVNNKNDDEQKSIINKFLQLLENCGERNIVKIRERYLKFCDETKANKILAESSEKASESGGNENNAVILSNGIGFSHNAGSKRKRATNEDNVIKTSGKKRKLSKYSQKFRCTNFKIFTYKLKNRLRKKLYIFDVNDNSELCHKYIWNEKTDTFACHTCVSDAKKHISTAKIFKGEDKKDFVEFGYHGCKAYEYEPGRCEERKIIRKPAYKLIKGIIDGEERQRLFIFDPTNMELCYIYSLTPNMLAFECLGCRQFRKSTKAKMYFEGTSEEYLEIFCEDHVCQLRTFNPESIFQQETILQKQFFEIHTVLYKGRQVQRLYVFDSDDRKYCFEYYCGKRKTFRCGKCFHKGALVYAKFDPQENNLRLCATSHVCEKQIYAPEESRNVIILDKSKFKIIPSVRKEGSIQIIIFHESDKTLCYTFSRTNKFDEYQCNGCKKMDAKYTVTLCKNENEEEYVQIKFNQKPHICTPKNLKNIKDPKIVKTADFIFYMNQKETKKLLIFTSSAKKYCYDYWIDPAGKHFVCTKCHKKETIANLYQAENDSEETYIRFVPSKHTCKPLTYVSIKKQISKIVKPEECITFKKTEASEEKFIIDFELRCDKEKVKDAILILFHPADKSLCYYYKYRKSCEKYFCVSCSKKNSHVFAKMETDENGQKYIIQGQKKHVCDAIKYEPEKVAEKFTNFIVIEKTKTNIEKLVIFTSAERTHCYVYRKKEDKYQCTRCTPMKYIWAKICEDETGLKYAEFSENEHICTPLEYNPANFIERKYLSPNEFELFPNTKGVPDSRVILLDPDDCNFGYEYKFTDRFSCNQCINVSKKRISAKLVKNENGEKCFELSNTEHLCQKLNFKEMGRIIYSSNYKINNDDDGNQTITTTHANDSKLCYKFAYDNTLQTFYCIGCQKKKKFIAAKICKKSYFEEFLLLAFDHVCLPLKM